MEGIVGKKDFFHMLSVISQGWKSDCPVHWTSKHVVGGTIQPPWTSFYKVSRDKFLKEGNISGLTTITKRIHEAERLLRGEEIHLYFTETEVRMKSLSMEIAFPLVGTKLGNDPIKDPENPRIGFSPLATVRVDTNFVSALRSDLQFIVETVEGRLFFRINCPFGTFKASWDTGVDIGKDLKAVFPSDLKRLGSIMWKGGDPFISINENNGRVLLIIHGSPLDSDPVFGVVGVGK